MKSSRGCVRRFIRENGADILGAITGAVIFFFIAYGGLGH